MVSARTAIFDRSNDCTARKENTVSLGRRYDAANFRITFRINWIVMLTVIASILLSQFAVSFAERHVSNLYGSKHRDGRNGMCLKNTRRSIIPQERQSRAKISPKPAIAPQDILSRMEAAATLRDHLVAALGRVLLLCLDDQARISFERIHNIVRTRRVAVYDLLRILPQLRHKIPRQQLYKVLQILERVGDRYVSEYASLCINAFSNVGMEEARLTDMLLGVDNTVIESILRDKYRAGAGPRSLTESMDFLLWAARNSSRFLDLRVVSAILLNYPTFDLTDSEVPDAMRFVARQMKARSHPDDPLLRYMEARLENPEDLLRTVLERLEVDELSSDATKEAISLLLQNLGAQSYPSAPSWKNNPRQLLTITNDYYPVHAVAVAKYLVDHLNESRLRNLDIGFYESIGDRALLQLLSLLRDQSDLQHLRKPLSLLRPFVSQKLINDANHDYAASVSFYEVNNYLDSFDTPCLQRNIADAMRMLRSRLSNDLPWTYAFGNRQMNEDPWELILTALIRLRSVPISRERENAIDNFIYKSRINALTGVSGSLYDSGMIFQRDDTINVELDLFSLLMRIPNVYKSEKFAPMLNFLSKPDILNILGYEFNKFEYESPRSLLLALLKRTLAISRVKSNPPLSRALRKAHNYLEEQLLVNLYTSRDLQKLLEHLPGIESDPRYLPLKILFRKQKLFAYLSPTFNLTNLHTSLDKLSLILKTISLKVTQSKTFSESLSFALDSIDGPPLPVRPFDRDDFIYLTKHLLTRNKTLQNEILKLPIYANVSDWNISMSGTPENVLARAMNYPIDAIANDAHLAYIVKQTESVLGSVLNIEILKRRTLESMAQYLPGSTYVKPVNLLLRKANLMTLVPGLGLASLENSSARDALIILLKNLTTSHVVRAEKLLLRRIRTALIFLDGANENDHQAPMVAYLIQSLQDPSNVAYKPLLRKMEELRNLTISYDKRQVWLRHYLQQIIAENSTKTLKSAASMALEDVTYEKDSSEKSFAAKARIKKALSFLPVDSSVEPLEKLLTPDLVYDILPEKLRDSDQLLDEELLLTILYYAKQRANVADNPSLMRAILKIETNLNGWRTNVEPLRKAVAAIKAAVYDPVKDLLTATWLNKFRLAVPPGGSAKESLLQLLRHLLSHPAIRKNDKVIEILNIIRQDIFAFGIDVDLLTVLDDLGIAYMRELAPIRLFLHRENVNEKFGHIVFAIVDPKERYQALLKILQEQQQLENDTRFLDALATLKNIRPTKKELAGTVVSDLFDIVNTIPHNIKQQFESIEYVFNANILSQLTRDNEIVESKNPLITLFAKMADLSEIRDNYTLANLFNDMRYEVKQLDGRPIITGFQLRPLLLKLRHVQEINVDFLSYLLDPEILSYLNSEEFSVMFDNSIEILRTIVDYMLNKDLMDVDYKMQQHLQSFKRILILTMGASENVRSQLTNEDWKKIMFLIPHKKDFAPVRIFLQSQEIFKYIPVNVNWKSFSSPSKKLLYLLTLVENDDIGNKNIRESANKLRENLMERFYFVTESNIKNMHRALASLKLQYDLVPLKIFLNHDNMIKYLPSNFRYTKYNTSINALVAVLDNLLHVPSLKRRTVLHKAMTYVKQSLLEQTRRSYHKDAVRNRVTSKELEFVGLLNMTLPSLRKFLNPQKLASLLPKTFNFENRPTFKMKALHLLHELLKLNTTIKLELEGLLREVEMYPDVPSITRDDLEPILKIIPTAGIPQVKLIKNYLKPFILIKYIPGNFDVKQSPNTRIALYDILMFLNVTLSIKSDYLQLAIEALIGELTKVKSNLMPREVAVDNNDIKSIINEIPFKRYKQIEQLEAQMTTKRVVSSLSLNFQLNEYKTKKLRLLAVLDELSKSDAFRSSIDLIHFIKRLVSKMPDMPKVNDTEIEKLLSPLPLNAFYMRHLTTSCKLNALAPYLPIHFDLGSIETRKEKITKILQYCKLNVKDISMRQALINAEAFLEMLPDFEATREHVKVLIQTIPCMHFTSLKPLLRLLSQKDIMSLLPWDLDLYKARTFKSHISDLLSALRNIKELQNDKMFTALNTLETNAKSLPDKIIVSSEHIKYLKSAVGINSQPCEAYREFVLRPENLIKILPSTYNFDQSSNYYDWSLIFYFSSLFLREVKVNGPIKEAFEYSVNLVRTAGKNYLQNITWQVLQYESFKHLVPLRLYTLGHADIFTQPIDDVYRGFFHGPLSRFIPVAMKQFIHKPKAIRSRALINNMEVFLHDYIYFYMRDKPSQYEVDMAIREIPNDDDDERYDDLELLMHCQDIQKPIMDKNISADGTSKQLLLDMLLLAEQGDIDAEIRKSIDSIKPKIERDMREEEAEYVLKQMRDYRYHLDRIEPIRSYLEREGLRKILGNDYLTKYPTYKERLVAISNILSASENFTSELLDASRYLKRILNNEIKIEYVIPRTVDDINVQMLFFALPQTRDENIIRGVIKFFSLPGLLRKLNLPKNPFEYVTKGRLLQAMMDLGQELKNVQEDFAQQEALEYFRDKIILTGPGAQPIELKKYAHNSNVNVDMYGMMRAIDYSKADEEIAAKVAMFFENKYDNLIHAVGFDHTAYTTRGAYLRALFEHLVNVSRVPDDVKQQIASLIPAIRFDGPGEEAIDLNDDIAPTVRLFEGPLDIPSEFHDITSRSSKRIGDSYTELPDIFQENKQLLRTAVQDVLQSVLKSEANHLDYIRGDTNDDYRDKSHVMTDVHDKVFDQKLFKPTIEHNTQSPPVRITMDDFDSPVEKMRQKKSLKIKEKKDRLTESSTDEDDVSLKNAEVKNEIMDGKAKRLKNGSSWEMRSDNFGEDSSIIKSPELSSEELSKVPRHRKHRKMTRKFLIRPDSNVDIEYYDDESVPNGRKFRDMMQSDKESFSAIEKPMAGRDSAKSARKTMKKDLSNRHTQKRGNT